MCLGDKDVLSFTDHPWDGAAFGVCVVGRVGEAVKGPAVL